VNVPGIHGGVFDASQTIAPIGWVEERWIHIGVGLTYLSQLGSTRLLLLGAVLGVCLGFLAVAFSALVSSQRREFAILTVLGWRPWQPIRLFLAQALILASGGGITGLGLALLLATLLEATPFWPVVVWTLPVMLVFALISILYPLWQLWHLRPAALLQAGSSTSSGRTILLGTRLGWLMPMGTFVLRNLGRSRVRTLITVVSLFLSAVLLVVMFSGVLTLHQELQGTLLGDYVLLQTAVPQVAGCVIAILVTFLSVADLLLLHVRERQREIGLLQAVGWRPIWIQRLFVQEGVALALLGTIPGVLVAQWILNRQHATQAVLPSPVLALSTVLLMTLVAACASIPALRTLNRMQVVDVLRSE
jgi:cell division protein FtsX